MEYIADFMCKELNLIIEVDGITHDAKEKIKKDRNREKDLVQAGFTVVKFTDEDILTNILGVTKKLRWLLKN